MYKYIYLFLFTLLIVNISCQNSNDYAIKIQLKTSDVTALTQKGLNIYMVLSNTLSSGNFSILASLPPKAVSRISYNTSGNSVFATESINPFATPQLDAVLPSVPGYLYTYQDGSFSKNTSSSIGPTEYVLQNGDNQDIVLGLAQDIVINSQYYQSVPLFYIDFASGNYVPFYNLASFSLFLAPNTYSIGDPIPSIKYIAASPISTYDFSQAYSNSVTFVYDDQNGYFEVFN
ncbi:hypothetical protein DLAC_05509 [Tieghemostelium lacteum]|uniref:Uncharacterized protein n=1 Tax=Tieghemostelium lacteum TaxID=361077 RepID=A0A151ZG17_TIELA|nr:hypothetical protein DLAC_05509 [Tieghemostelium lacteum]|eukprot:KYQ92916.1 hypothetical protein DLAC_05509 [Tieghemostelium lacteum]